MRRREFIAVVGGTAVWPLLAHAQQLRRRIGYLSGTGNQSDRGPFLEAMLRGLEEFGYVEGKNIIIEYRGAAAREERIPGLISELVELKPDVLVMPPVWWAIEIAKEKTKTIPIAMVASDDPVIMGLVKSLSRPDLDATLQNAATQVGGLITITNTALFAHRKQIADLAIKYRLPTMYHGADWVEAGGLMSYAADDREAFHRIAYYVDKILKGAWPGDLPIEQSTKIALVINLQTAKALELSVPSNLLVAADKVIE